MKFNFYIRFLLALLAASSLNQVVTAQEVSFSPSRVFFKGNPGETVTETVSINNAGTETFEFIASVQDWKRDTLGMKIFSPGGTLLHSNASAIKLPLTSMQVLPGEKKNFTISMLIPPAEKRDSLASNSMLFLTQTNAQKARVDAGSGIGIRVHYEFGIQVFYTPNGAKTGEMNFLEFQSQEVLVDKKKTTRLAVKFENTGEIHKDGQLRFELTNKETGEEIKLPPVPMAITPKSFQWAYCPLPAQLAKGSYLAVAILNNGENIHIKVAEKEFDIKN
jgi:hypothetical protein